MVRSAFSRRAFCRGALTGGALMGASLPLCLGFAQSAPVTGQITLADVNHMDLAAFVSAFGNTFESSPWVARAAYAKRPFASVTALHQALFDVLYTASRDVQHAFFRDLPDIGAEAVKANAITDASRSEQEVAGISALGEAELARLRELNKAYRTKFNFSFTICVRRNAVETIFTQFERRLKNEPSVELATALQEEFFITRLRVAEQVTGEGMPLVYGDLSAHVLNAIVGKPAGGVAIELFEVSGEQSRRVVRAVTDADGRADVLSGRPLPIGRYELRFALGNYFRKNGGVVDEPPFLDVVPIRFFIDNPEFSYHLPIVCTPWGYSTHR